MYSCILLRLLRLWVDVVVPTLGTHMIMLSLKSTTSTPCVMLAMDLRPCRLQLKTYGWSSGSILQPRYSPLDEMCLGHSRIFIDSSAVTIVTNVRRQTRVQRAPILWYMTIAVDGNGLTTRNTSHCNLRCVLFSWIVGDVQWRLFF